MDGVPGGDAALKPGGLDQLGAAVGVADGEDVLHVGAQEVVDRDRHAVAGDAGGVEVQAVEVGRPADGGEDRADLHLPFLAVADEVHDGPVSVGLQFGHPGTGADVHAPGLERGAQRCGDVGVSEGDQGGAELEESDGDAEVVEDRGDLAAGVGAADHHHLVG